MRGIILKDSIQLFGFKDGFNFWFRHSFVHPVQEFIWLNITHKHYCIYSGWHCHNENCKHLHLKTKEEILENMKESEKELNRVEAGKDGMCIYCRMERGTIQIPNPNFDEINQWLVCKNCKEIIDIQRELSFLSIFKIDNPKRVEELNNRLLEISEQTGKSIINMEISKENDGYKTSSVTFTGKKKNDK